MKGVLNMIRLIKTEFLKYKRYNIVWLGIVSIFFSIILAVFQLTGTKNSIVSYAGLSEGVIWNHFSSVSYTHLMKDYHTPPEIYDDVTSQILRNGEWQLAENIRPGELIPVQIIFEVPAPSEEAA